jgi:hypothetical protein
MNKFSLILIRDLFASVKIVLRRSNYDYSQTIGQDAFIVLTICLKKNFTQVWPTHEKPSICPSSLDMTHFLSNIRVKRVPILTTIYKKTLLCLSKSN